MRKIDKISRNNKGFTLIDVSIILLIIGLLVTPILRDVDIKYKKARVTYTNASLRATDVALEQFYLLNNDYPCPADPTLSEADANYGLSVVPCDAPSDPDPAVGAVPFKDLKIPVKHSIDGYKNKITYSVSKNITNFGAPGFTTTGTLNFQRTERDTTTIPGTTLIVINNTMLTGHYALISHGENGIGAFTADGTALAACAPGALQESENCDNDVRFIAYALNVTLVNGANYYDDRTELQESSPTRIWVNSSADVNDILSTAGLIGVGTSNPEVALDVEGNIKTNAGDANVKDLCQGYDVTNTDCFQAGVIGGSGVGPGNGMGAGKDCAPGSVMIGISNGGADCNLGIAAPSMANNKCGANEYVWAISATGVLSCTLF